MMDPSTAKELVVWQMNLIDQLNSYTLEYIGIAVAVVIALGGFLYFFTLKPFEKELARQSDLIKDARIALEKIVIDSEIKLKKEIEQQQKNIEESTAATLQQYEENVLLKAKNENLSLLGDLEEKFSMQLKDVNIELSQLNVSRAESSKDIASLSTKLQSHAETLDDVNIDIIELQAHMYSQKGKMGGLIMPLDGIDKVLGTPQEYRVEYFLTDLLEEIPKSPPTSEIMERINKTMPKIPSNYDSLKAKILTLISPVPPDDNPNPKS